MFLSALNETHSRSDICHPKCDLLRNIVSPIRQCQKSNDSTKNKKNRILQARTCHSCTISPRSQKSTMTLLLRHCIIWGHLIMQGNVCQDSCHPYLITVQANTMEHNYWVQTNNTSKPSKTIRFSHLLDCKITRCEENRSL